MSLIQAATNYITNLIYPKPIEQQKITLAMAQAAARWWAQYLPGAKDISFKDIDVNSKLEDQVKKNFLEIVKSTNEEKIITDEQYDKCV